jgi:hypothetical protein
MCDGANFRTDELPPPRPCLPPLRLHHFFAWTAVSAALLALSRAFNLGPVRIAPWWTITQLPSDFLFSLALTCCGFGLYWRRRGLNVPSQPGHGLLLTHAVGYIFSMGLSLLWLATFDPESSINRLQPLMKWLTYGATLVTAGLNVWLAWWTRPARRWQVFYLITALVTGNAYHNRILDAVLISPVSNLEWIGPGLATGMRFTITQMPWIAPAVALIVAVVLDRRDRIPRHWSHWAGIAAWLQFVPGLIVYLLINAGWLPLPFTPK